MYILPTCIYVMFVWFLSVSHILSIAWLHKLIPLTERTNSAILKRVKKRNRTANETTELRTIIYIQLQSVSTKERKKKRKKRREFKFSLFLRKKTSFLSIALYQTNIFNFVYLILDVTTLNPAHWNCSDIFLSNDHGSFVGIVIL